MERLSIATLLVATLASAVRAQNDTAAWIAWTRANHFPIASIVSTPQDDFTDLRFFKDVIGERRLVQLGESGHGVGQFDSAKVRLIKFFHEQMGFDVIAFESSIYECFAANTNATNPVDMLQRSIFTVWATESASRSDRAEAVRRRVQFAHRIHPCGRRIVAATSISVRCTR